MDILYDMLQLMQLMRGEVSLEARCYLAGRSVAQHVSRLQIPIQVIQGLTPATVLKQPAIIERCRLYRRLYIHTD